MNTKLTVRLSRFSRNDSGGRSVSLHTGQAGKSTTHNHSSTQPLPCKPTQWLALSDINK